ncbi:hypothetical protein [Echinicola shivajiensis]|uniref:hypothetical protein n=1 Tax=Echinicola shivajiensis TaxID=1035916 RepID=UPI001BFC4AE0|nr:hypothetical protein [Echinicola shivajiensis]
MVFFYLTNFLPSDEGHEVHVQGCPEMPKMDSLTYLGPFNNCHEALRSAKRKFSAVSTCPHCCSMENQSIVSSED